MEVIEKSLRFTSLIIGVIGILIVIFFNNNPDLFSQEFFGEIRMGGEIHIWLICFYLLFALLGLSIKSSSTSSKKIMCASLLLVAGFVAEIIWLIKLMNSLLLTGSCGSCYAVIIINFFAIVVLIILFLNHFIKTVKKSEDDSYELEISRLKFIKNVHLTISALTGISGISLTILGVLILVLSRDIFIGGFSVYLIAGVGVSLSATSFFLFSMSGDKKYEISILKIPDNR